MSVDRIVGILALQGDFAAHATALCRQGLATREIRVPDDLVGLAGLGLPGGESTTGLKLLSIQRLRGPLGSLLGSGIPVLATCAGTILCARRVVDPEQPSLGAIDIEVARNGYGRQIRSRTVELACPGGEAMSGVFIRAPRILSAGPGVEVLARRDRDPVLVRQGSIVGACFHPELEDDHPVTVRFASEVVAAAG